MSVKRNAVFSVVEVTVGGLGLFFIYKNVVSELGVAMLGVWSLVLATTAFGRMAGVGFAAFTRLGFPQAALQYISCVRRNMFAIAPNPTSAAVGFRLAKRAHVGFNRGCDDFTASVRSLWQHGVATYDFRSKRRGDLYGRRLAFVFFDQLCTHGRAS